MYRKILLAALVAVVAGLLSAAYVGAIGATAACPAWPLCDGQALAGAMAVEPVKIWAVQAQRLIQFAELALVLAALALAFGRASPLAPALAVLAVAGQIALAALAPAYHFHPLLLAGDTVLATAAMGWIYRAWLVAGADTSVPTAPAGTAPRALVAVALIWLVLQVAIGAWVSATHSGTACPELPTCLGHWWPPAEYAQGFAVWRGLPDDQPLALGLAGRVAVNWVHRVSGVGLIALLTVIGVTLASGRYGKRAARNGTVISALACAQLVTAVLAVKFRIPVAAALIHAALAAGLWLHLLRAAHQLGRVPRVALPPQPLAVGELVREALVVPRPVAPPVAEAAAAPSLLQRLRHGLRKTGGGLAGLLAGLSGSRIDDSLLEDIETTLLMADVGVEATQVLVKSLATEYPKDTPVSADGVRGLLKQQMLDMLAPSDLPLQIDTGRKPFVILVVGVNGVGKTTTIGKLARRYQNDGHTVMLAAGDTFRAAAVEQLQTWGERNNIPVVAQHSGADSASVIYDAMQSAQAKAVDILIADTAGRLHTKSNLMEELSKVKRILGRLDERAPHEVLLVLDAGTGQNAIAQARQFHESVNLTGIAVTKLDGTAKGGVIFALARQFGIPIRYIGVGEGIEDLQDFHAETFVDALLGQDTA